MIIMNDPITFDDLGELADKCDNLVAASQLPLPPSMHIEQLRDGLVGIATMLKRYHIQETGENPWGII